MKKTILAPAVALSLGLTGALGFAAAPVLAENAGETNEKGTLTLSANKLTLEEFKSKGVTAKLEGATPGHSVTYTLYREGGDEALATSTDSSVVAIDGKHDSGPLTVDNPEEGTYRVKAVTKEVASEAAKAAAADNGTTYEASFTVGEATPEEPGEGGNDGEENPEQPGDNEGTQPPAPGEGDGGDGDGTEDPTNPSDDGSDEGGSDEGGSDEGGSDEGDDAEAKDPALSLSDKKVTAADFVNKKKGVVATVSGLEPGTKVKFTVTGVSGNAKNVKPYETTVIADEDGNAVFSAAGLSKSNPSAYLGTYTVTAEFDDQKLEDSFEVVSGKGSSDADESEETGSGGGSVSGGASDDVSGSTTSGSSDYLPRTGQGLGGLAAGVALLTIGGATVLLTRRTRKA